ncbi:MAG: hypothetical protein ACRD2J_18180, partial [Thermoanaerobaculia bacterium]
AKPPAPAARPPRRPRPKYESSAEPTAAWFPQRDASRVASFIPAPHRAQAPSNTAAPPAMADREVRASDLSGVGMGYRVHPVRVDIEYSGGRALIHLNPEESTIRAGEAIEWDFRYSGGADLMVDEIVIEFPKPSPFGKTILRAKKPNSPRHKQMSGPSGKTTGRIEYTIRCLNSFKSEVASAKLRLVIT